MLYTIRKKKQDEAKAREASFYAALESWANPHPVIDIEKKVDSHGDSRRYQYAEDPISLWREQCASLECEKIIASRRYPPLLKELAEKMIKVGHLLSSGENYAVHESLLFIADKCEMMFRAKHQHYKAGLPFDIPPEYDKFYSAAVLLMNKTPIYPLLPPYD